MANTLRSMSATVKAQMNWSPTGSDLAHNSTGRWRPRTRRADTTLVSKRYFIGALNEPSDPYDRARTRCRHPLPVLGPRSFAETHELIAVGAIDPAHSYTWRHTTRTLTTGRFASYLGEVDLEVGYVHGATAVVIVRAMPAREKFLR